MRTLALLVAVAPAVAFADEVDLSKANVRDDAQAPRLVLRLEGGNEFAPYGYIGGCVSWLIDGGNELELGAGGGYPGLQMGFAARHLFGEGGQHALAELFLAGNTRVNRGLDQNSAQVNPAASQASSSLWTGLGFGFEQRQDFYSLSIAGNIVFTSTSLTPHWALHGGLGFGF